MYLLASTMNVLLQKTYNIVISHMKFDSSILNLEQNFYFFLIGNEPRTNCVWHRIYKAFALEIISFFFLGKRNLLISEKRYRDYKSCLVASILVKFTSQVLPKSTLLTPNLFNYKKDNHSLYIEKIGIHSKQRDEI